MVQLALSIKRNWFSLGFLLIVCFSIGKRVDIFAWMPFNVNKVVIKNQVVPIQAKFVSNRQSTLLEQKVPSKINQVLESKFPADRDSQVDQKFIQRFSKVAKQEMNNFDIPASIILAHALLESNGKMGKRNTRNNFFNIPCSETASSKRCFKQYDTPWYSFRGHSKYLTSGKYKYLTRIPIQNLNEWAKSIQAIGYPNQLDYDDRMLDIIQRYQLHELDTKSEKV